MSEWSCEELLTANTNHSRTKLKNILLDSNTLALHVVLQVLRITFWLLDCNQLSRNNYH